MIYLRSEDPTSRTKTCVSIIDTSTVISLCLILFGEMYWTGGQSGISDSLGASISDGSLNSDLKSNCGCTITATNPTTAQNKEVSLSSLHELSSFRFIHLSCFSVVCAVPNASSDTTANIPADTTTQFRSYRAAHSSAHGSSYFPAHSGAHSRPHTSSDDHAYTPLRQWAVF